MEELCPFCAELADPTYYQRKINPGWPFPEGRVMYRNDGTMVIPGHGPQVYPYALVIPFAHESSFVYLSVKQRQSVFSALDWLTDLPVFSGYACVFEHGGGSGPTCQCIDHCHLHIVRLELASRLQALLTRKVVKKAHPRALQLMHPGSMSDSYLFVGSYRRGFHRIDGTWAIPRQSEPQLLRRLLADCLGLRWWDWRSPRATDNQKLMEQLYELREEK